MDKKTFTRLTIITLVAVIAATIAVQTGDQAPPDDLTGEAFFPELLAHINDVAAVTVQQGQDSIHLQRPNGDWLVKEKENYPADFGKVKQTLVQMAELSIIEPKTSKPELFARLGVEDSDQAGANSLSLTLYDGDEREMAALIIGNRRDLGAGLGNQALYVRKMGAQQAWLVKGAVDAQGALDYWLDKVILDLPTQRLRRMSVTHGNKQALVIEKQDPAQSDYSLRGIPAGSEPKSAFEVNNIATVAQALAFEELVPAAEAASFTGADQIKVTFETFEGLLVNMVSEEKDGKHYARFEADYYKQSEPTQGSNDETSEGTPPEALAAEITRLQHKWGNWVYAIPAFKITTLSKTMDELIKPKEDPASE